MKYLMLPGPEREALFAALDSMPEFLERHLARVDAVEATLRGPDGSLSPVEQCWHLADLEREAFAVRIARLRRETDPELPDFDGGRIAEQRRYATRRVADGLESFREARRANLATLRDLEEQEWLRAGTQEGVGRIQLCDLPAMMAEHDAVHRGEIEQWCRRDA